MFGEYKLTICIIFFSKNDACLVNSLESCSQNLNNSNNDFDDNDEDEEVFFGPQTHNERIVAVIVKEKEAQQQCPLETLTAEQQALLLRETALLSARIKHGTPGGNAKGSPVAVVHPMPRSVDSFPFSTTTNISDNKENYKPQLDALQKLKSSQAKDIKKLTVSETKKVPTSMPQLLQHKFGLNKGRSSSQPETSLSTKLPVAQLRRTKIQSEISEVCKLLSFF